MATSASPLGASASAGFDSAMDAAFDKIPATESTSEESTDAPVQDALVAEEADPVVEETQEEEVVDPVVAPPVAEEELDPYDEIQPDKVTDNGRTLHFTKQKAGLLLAARDFERKVGEIMPGATTEEIAHHYQQSVVASEMVADFDSGDPTRVAKVADFYLGSQSSPKSIEAFASSIFERLPHAAPQLYQHFEQQAVKNTAQQYYEQAIRSDDKALFALAQNLDHKLSGKFLMPEDFKARDPYAEERAQFEKERNDFNAVKKAEATRGQQVRVQGLDREIDSLRSEEVIAGLKSVEEQFKDTPHWKHMQRDLSEKVQEAITANPTWARQFAIKKNEAVQDTTGKAGLELKSMMKNFVGRIVAQHRKGVISAVTGQVLSASKTAHQQAAQQAAKREPNGSQAPVKSSPYKQQLRNASYDDAFELAFNRRK